MAGLEQYARDEAPLPLGDVLKLGKFGVQTLFPQTYSAATSWIPSLADLGLPSMSEIGASLGLEGLGSTLGGFGAAMLPAGAFLAWAKIMSAINQNTDHPITLGSGYTSLDDGFYGGSGPEVARAKALSDLFLGDRSWYAGGDPSLASDLDTAIGSMSWKKSVPAYSVGGAPYRTPELAVNSGRQISRGQMGLPVTLEDLPDTYRSSPGLALLAQYQGNQSLPVWDADMAVPTDWDTWQERAQNSGYSGQSNTEAGSAWAPETIQAFVSGLTPRAREWFRTGLTTGDLYAYTGENSPDYGAINGYAGSGGADVAAVPSPVETVPFNPLTYGSGPGRRFFADR